MSVYKYITIKEVFENPEIGTYTSYGLKAMQGNKEILTISDVSLDKTFVEGLARMYTEYQLDPIHLFEVVEDALP